MKADARCCSVSRRRGASSPFAAALFVIGFVAPGVSELLSLRPEGSSMIGAILGLTARSKHMEGTVFDIAMSNDPAAFEAAAREAGFLGFGFYPHSDFMHIDLGPARHWGERFPPRPTAFAPEIPPARERLAESRTIKGGGGSVVGRHARPPWRAPVPPAGSLSRPPY